jgi:hypothetical protein
MQGDTAVGIGRARKELVRKVAVQLLSAMEATLGLAQDLQWNRRVKPVVEESLMGGGVIGLHKVLMRLLERCGGASQGELVVIQSSLDIKMGLHEVLIALALSAFNRLMVDLQPGQHCLKGPGGERPPLSEIKVSGTP